MTNTATNAVSPLKDEQTNTKNYQESSTGAKIAGSAAAAGSIFVTNSVANKIKRGVNLSVAKSIASICEYEKANGESIGLSIVKMCKEQGLKEKGIKIFDYSKGIPLEASRDWYLACTGGIKRIEDIQSIEEFNEFVQKHPRKYAKMLGKEHRKFEKQEKLISMMIDDPKGFRKKHPIRCWIVERKLENALKILGKYGTTDIDIIMMEKCPWLYKTIEKQRIKKFDAFFNPQEQVLSGANMYAVGNKIHCNTNFGLFRLFTHEGGHVDNNIGRGLGKVLSKIRHLNTKACLVLTPLIFGTAILRDKKPEGQSSETAIGKGLDFIKDNCVGLAALTQLPNLAEEGLASKKGLKMIKDYVKPNEYKMLRGAMGRAWLTYFGAAAATTAAVYVANSVKNAISGPKENTVCTA